MPVCRSLIFCVAYLILHQEKVFIDAFTIYKLKKKSERKLNRF